MKNVKIALGESEIGNAGRNNGNYDIPVHLNSEISMISWNSSGRSR